ncbi:phage tail tape measure protein [Paraburkholderia sp. SIMBA_030]|uniref:phage tail tape measure protein n=1 Tax=Paraburkholderia sp. SIMBA_030 TaxID=3085773 RepID=UPI00397E27D9
MKMARNDLKLRVLFDMVDGATRPIKSIINGSKGLAAGMKASRDRLKELGEAQKRIGQFAELKRGMQGASERARESQARVRALAQQMKSTANPSRELARAFGQATRESRQANAQLAQHRQRLDAARSSLTANGISTSNLAKHQRTLNEQTAAANRGLRQQEEKLKRVTREQQRMRATREKFDKAKNLAGSTAAIGATSTALGGGVLMSARGLLTPAVEYNAAMSKVQALARIDRNSEEFRALRAQSRELGATTSYTATQAADGQGFLAMAGFKPDQILKSMPSVLAMAKAGDADLARTADISSNIMSGFGLQADEMSRVADVLTMTFTTANTNLDMLGETMKYMGPVAKAAGMSLEEAAAMAGLLGNVGIQASQAGTTLRSMLLRLASPTSKASKALKELGVSSRDAKGNVRDITSVLSDVAAKTEKMGSGERLGYLKRIFGEEPAAGMAELIAQQGTRGIDKYVEIVKASAGIATQTAAIMADNLKGDLLTAKSAWEDFGITVSDTVDGPLRKVTRTVTETIRKVSEWSKRNPELTATITKIALVAGAALGVLGALTLAFAAVLVPMAAVKMSLGVLGIKGGSAIGMLWNLGARVLPFLGTALKVIGRAAMTNPIGLTITAIAVAALLIYRYWEPIKAFFRSIWEEVRAAFDGGLAGIGALILNWSPLGLFHRAFAAVLRWFGIDVPAKFSEFGANLISGLVNGITKSLGTVKSAITNVASSTVTWFKEKLGIHSPSRVFGELGGFITQGAAIGMQAEQGRIAKAAVGLATLAATSFAGTGAAQAAGDPGVTIDTRPALQARHAAANGANTAAGGNQYVFHITGADPKEIANQVRQAIEQIERKKASRVSSRLSD